ncbi:hypothetical protein CLIM01_08397 [Colletotrichum limetticola]|uniref:Uncharacterized protein n=1 Tax=Colletotrichum limetticola TaxID=1209924 RepID=A0ABQ9PRT6_9PEZI|nr:hypothetical protein CLIM01_08397 [Colletotrichum limetticola]
MLDELLGGPLNITERMHQNIWNGRRSTPSSKIKETSQYLLEWQASWDIMSQTTLVQKSAKE